MCVPSLLGLRLPRSITSSSHSYLGNFIHWLFHIFRQLATLTFIGNSATHDFTCDTILLNSTSPTSTSDGRLHFIPPLHTLIHFAFTRLYTSSSSKYTLEILSSQLFVQIFLLNIWSRNWPLPNSTGKLRVLLLPEHTFPTTVTFALDSLSHLAGLFPFMYRSCCHRVYKPLSSHPQSSNSKQSTSLSSSSCCLTSL